MFITISEIQIDTYKTINTCTCAVNVEGHYEINPWKSLNGPFQGFQMVPVHKIETFRWAWDFFGPLIFGPKKSRAPWKVEILCKGTILNPWNGPFSDFQRVYFIMSNHIYSTGTLVILCHLFSTLFLGLFWFSHTRSAGGVVSPPSNTHVFINGRGEGAIIISR